MKSITIETVIRRANEPIVKSDQYFYSSDHTIVATPREIDSEVAEFVRDAGRYRSQIDTLALILPVSGRADVTQVLDAAGSRLNDDPSVIVQHGFVSSTMLNRLTCEYSHVKLIGCTLGRGWWKSGGGEKRCRWLDLYQCQAAPLPKSTKLSCAAWAKLEDLHIDGGHWEQELNPATVDQGPEAKHHTKLPSRIEDFVRAYYHPGVDQLGLWDCGDIGFLANCPAGKVKDLTLPGCALTNELLEWMTDFQKLDSLTVTWRKGEKLDWTKLRSLKKLRFMDVTNSPCSDDDLVQILATTKLRTIHAYYTDITPKSWKPLLTHPTMRIVWVGQGMMGDSMPDLPEETKVKEIVGLNVSDTFMDFINEIAARYPGMKTCRM